MANASQTQLAYVEEVTPGVTPATPAFQVLRFTGESLNANITNVKSNEIRADRNVPDLIQVSASSGGAINVEISYGSFDDLLESALYSAWSTDTLINGVTQKTFTIEKLFETGATDQYHRFTRCVVDNMSLSIGAQGIITATFTFIAGEFSTATTAITGATYTAVNTNDVMNASTDFSGLALNGVTSPRLQTLNLSISNSLREQPEAGSLYSTGIGAGQFEVTGDGVIYFDDAELYDLFVAGTESDLAFKIGGASSKNYVFTMQKLKFATASVNAGSNDEDLVVNFTFQALYNASDAGTLKIERTA